MFSKKKNTSKLDLEQRELYENARKRTLQKKRLFQHFVIFLVGAVLLIILNVVIGYKEEFMPLGYNWFVWAILIWTFFFLIHLINVFVTSSLMGKEWEQRQMEKLVQKQRDRIREMEQQVQRDHPLPSEKKYDERIRIRDENSQNPDKPLNH
ncbi:2TM domain-containing protein [Antarcticibacterium sp. 1MA-6-2]|uniref:2TM domain-containing protein n=1 Tax=Antarcticibacterium sp. 1MA-6-2 TaxID=2908210 RepID=UPI001F42E175|nr:2TM domain-containing protein [Antarcticibacterium sp. 1MA-6-2]UJH92835.1 2TM domain-containing protein [Antarcticibacterium sp. 1MA-6-2]